MSQAKRPDGVGLMRAPYLSLPGMTFRERVSGIHPLRGVGRQSGAITIGRSLVNPFFAICNGHIPRGARPRYSGSASDGAAGTVPGGAFAPEGSGKGEGFGSSSDVAL